MNNNKKMLSLEPRQKALYKRLVDKKPILAKIYLGAILILQHKENPDYLALAGHNIRELMEKMPLYVDIRISPSTPLGVKVRELFEVWKPLGLLCEENFEVNNNDSSKKLRKFIEKVAVFFQWYENHNPTRHGQLKVLLRKLDPAKRSIPEALGKINIELWDTIRGYFISVSHHNTEVSEEEFMEYLFYLESFLADKLIPRTFDDMKDIDEIIGVKTIDAD